AIVKDVGGNSVTIAGSSNVTVANTPVIVTARPQTALVGVPIPTGTVVATFLDDAGSDPTTNYTALINWGDATPVVTGTVTSLGGGQYQVASAAPHTYTHSGVFTLTVTVNDSDGASGVGSALVFVAAAPIVITPPPVQGPNNPASAVEGQPKTFILGTFTSGSPIAVPGEFVAQVDWGDGSPQSVALVTPLLGSPGTFQITGVHTYLEETTPGFPT